MSQISYEDRGVSPDKPDVEAAISESDRGLFPGAFCHVVPDLLGADPNYCALMHADGVGTKSAIAMLMHREFGDYSAFDGLAQDSIVMNTDDVLCVGATGSMLVSNTIGRNAQTFDAEMLRRVIAGYAAFVKNLKPYGLEFSLCGGETADLGDTVRSVVIDSTICTRMQRSKVIDASQVKPDYAIVGLASFGKASYEARENSGIGTNGLTAVRHEVLSPKYRDIGPDTFNPSNAETAYVGRYSLGDDLPNGDGMKIGDAFLSPTRTYLPVVKSILANPEVDIAAMFHNTGGGLTKCLKFGSGIRYVKDNLFEPPAIFNLVCEAGNMAPREIIRVLNLGQRFEIVCAHKDVPFVIETSERFGIPAQVIGYTEKI